jgi:hypothetical protein
MRSANATLRVAFTRSQSASRSAKGACAMAIASACGLLPREGLPAWRQWGGTFTVTVQRPLSRLHKPR